MSENYIRYNNMKTRNLEKYYELSQVMSEYRSHDVASQYQKKKFFLIAGTIVALLLLTANTPGLLLLVVVPLLAAILYLKVMLETDKRVFGDVFLERAIDAGHSRSEAVEYLYDKVFDDYLGTKPDLDEIQQELNNVKNQ